MSAQCCPEDPAQPGPTRHKTAGGMLTEPFRRVSPFRFPGDIHKEPAREAAGRPAGEDGGCRKTFKTPASRTRVRIPKPLQRPDSHLGGRNGRGVQGSSAAASVSGSVTTRIGMRVSGRAGACTPQTRDRLIRVIPDAAWRFSGGPPRHPRVPGTPPFPSIPPRTGILYS